MCKTEKVFLICVCIFTITFCSYSVYRGTILYDADDYCCRHMARDAEQILESIGIPVILVRGHNEEGGHLWFSIYGISIDSVSLLPFPMEVFYPEEPNYFINWDDYVEHKHSERYRKI